MTPFDRLLARRAVIGLAVTLAVVLAIIVATDEATSTPGMRLSRLAAFEPISALVAVLFVVNQARTRGELRALEGLGVPPWTAARGAVVGGVLGAGLALMALVSPWADPRSLLPVARTAVDWVMDPNGAFATAPSVFVSESGVLALSAVSGPGPRAAPSSLAALPSVALLAFLVPAWAVTPMPTLVRATTLCLSGAIVVLSLHLVAAERAPPMVGALSAAPVLLSTLLFRKRR